MDATMDDDCSIETVVTTKKKKLKQARLPFQMLGSGDTPNSPSNKKRKLTSPSIEYKSPKVIKITTKENSIEDNNEKEVQDNKKSTSHNDDNMEIVKEVHLNGTQVKESEETDHAELTPKRHSIGKGSKVQKKAPESASALVKFLKQPKESADTENSKKSSEDRKKIEDEVVDVPKEKKPLIVSKKIKGATKQGKEVEKESENKSDSDIEVLSSDNDCKEEDKSTSTGEKESAMNSSPKTPKTQKRQKRTPGTNTKRNKQTSKQQEKKSESALNYFKQPKDTENVEELEKPSMETKKDQDVSLKTSDPEESNNSDSDVELLSSDNEGAKAASPKTPRTPRTPMHDKSSDNALRKLTPKQQERKLESARRREERERLRMEKDKKLEEERENKRKEREEKKREKEEKEQLEKEQKLKEKEQKQLKKQMEIEQKQKEKEAKEEERRKKEEAKEEEKKRREEEKLEAERKKQKAATTFASFFVAKKLESRPFEDETVEQVKNFMPFEVKADMKIAPVSRRTMSDDEKNELDDKLQATKRIQKSRLYLAQIKNKQVTPRTCAKTWPQEVKDDVILMDEESDVECNLVETPVAVDKQRPKLLQFSENRRPPYYGTWRKRSSTINPRRPFSRDAKWFNYEVDSDEEWEEEEEGESLRGSDDEKDEENPESNEYDVDNEFMVPHGYLSDEEVRADEEDKEDMSPETQKFKLKVLGDQFECERNEKTLKLKPKIIGCIWQVANGEFAENVSSKLVEFLSVRRAWTFQNPVILPSKAEQQSAASGENSTPTKPSTATTSRKTKVPKEALPDLIRLVHGNIHGKNFLVREFMAYWNRKHELGESRMSKASLAQKIRDVGKWMACPEEGPMHLKACWYVTESIRKQYLPEDEPLTLPNRWSYILTPKRRAEIVDVPEKSEKEEKIKEKEKEKDKEKRSVPLITQFTKKITHEEMKKQLTSSGTSSPQSKKAPKRATLISVGIGEQFTKTSRENLLKSFLPSNKPEDTKSNSDSDDDVMVLDEPSTTVVDVNEGTKEKISKSETVHATDSKIDKNSSLKATENGLSETNNDTDAKPAESSNDTSEIPMEVDKASLDE